MRSKSISKITTNVNELNVPNKIRGNHKGLTKEKNPKYMLSTRMNFKIQTQIIK